MVSIHVWECKIPFGMPLKQYHRKHILIVDHWALEMIWFGWRCSEG